MQADYRDCESAHISNGEIDNQTWLLEKKVDDFSSTMYFSITGSVGLYSNERQRVQIAAEILLASDTGCRPCSLSDTGHKTLDDSESTVLRTKFPKL